MGDLEREIFWEFLCGHILNIYRETTLFLLVETRMSLTATLAGLFMT